MSRMAHHELTEIDLRGLNSKLGYSSSIHLYIGLWSHTSGCPLGGKWMCPYRKFVRIDFVGLFRLTG